MVALTDSRNRALAGLRVLVVEDDPAIGAQLVRGLARAGCAPRLVTSAGEALCETGMGLVLLDLGLPDLDGVEVCLALRRRSAVPVIPWLPPVAPSPPGWPRWTRAPTTTSSNRSASRS